VEAEVVVRFRVRLDEYTARFEAETWAQEFADELQYSYPDLVEDVEILEVDEV